MKLNIVQPAELPVPLTCFFVVCLSCFNLGIVNSYVPSFAFFITSISYPFSSFFEVAYTFVNAAPALWLLISAIFLICSLTQISYLIVVWISVYMINYVFRVFSIVHKPSDAVRSIVLFSKPTPKKACSIVSQKCLFSGIFCIPYFEGPFALKHTPRARFPVEKTGFRLIFQKFVSVVGSYIRIKIYHMHLSYTYVNTRAT